MIIPVFDHEHAIGAMVEGVLASGLDCLLVDDGSGAACARVLDELETAHAPRLRLLRLARNQGKGGAVMAGFREAARLDVTHVLQIDADGQHDPATSRVSPRLRASIRMRSSAGCPNTTRASRKGACMAVT